MLWTYGKKGIHRILYNSAGKIQKFAGELQGWERLQNHRNRIDIDQVNWSLFTIPEVIANWHLSLLPYYSQIKFKTFKDKYRN